MATMKGCTAGWFLVLLAVSVLLVRGQFGLLILLLAVSLLFACGIMWPGHHRSDPAHPHEKR
ncbi:MAG: hypothetical protein WB952_07850 [Terriglobales bacterium]